MEKNDSHTLSVSSAATVGCPATGLWNHGKPVDIAKWMRFQNGVGGLIQNGARSNPKSWLDTMLDGANGV